MTRWLVSGRPRQFIEMWLKSRCSILFHLLVPGGRWQTVMARPQKDEPKQSVASGRRTLHLSEATVRFGDYRRLRCAVCGARFTEGFGEHPGQHGRQKRDRCPLHSAQSGWSKARDFIRLPSYKLPPFAGLRPAPSRISSCRGGQLTSPGECSIRRRVEQALQVELLKLPDGTLGGPVWTGHLAAQLGR